MDVRTLFYLYKQQGYIIAQSFCWSLIRILRLFFYAQDGLIGLPYYERNISPQVQEVFIKDSCAPPWNDLYLRMCVPCVRYSLSWKYHQICLHLIKKAFLETTEQTTFPVSCASLIVFERAAACLKFCSNTINTFYNIIK